jgi:hypothetical protein
MLIAGSQVDSSKNLEPRMNTDKDVREQQQKFQSHTGDVKPSKLNHRHLQLLSVFIRVHPWFQILAWFTTIEDIHDPRSQWNSKCDCLGAPPIAIDHSPIGTPYRPGNPAKPPTPITRNTAKSGPAAPTRLTVPIR